MMRQGIASRKAETAVEWDTKMAATGLQESIAGQGLKRQEAVALATNALWDELLQAARDVREQGKGETISYSKKVFIPLTTLCRDYCSYCTFRKDPGQPGAHFMTPEEVLALAEEGQRAGCKEALFSLGDQPERIFPEAREFLRRQGYARTLDYLAAMCELVLERKIGRASCRERRED